MDDNEKLLEAARMIKTHCKNAEYGDPCCFSVNGLCICKNDCSIGNMHIIPSNWNIASRWSEADTALAKVLMAFGVEKIKHFNDERVVIYASESGTYLVKNVLPKGAFAALNPDETIMLKDVVKEGT